MVLFLSRKKENKKWRKIPLTVSCAFFVFFFFSAFSPKKERKKEKKEVIQPQVPLRLPCDDLTLLAELRFDFIENEASSKPCSGGLTGGVCKEQGHIHRATLTPAY